MSVETTLIVDRVLILLLAFCVGYLFGAYLEFRHGNKP